MSLTRFTVAFKHISQLLYRSCLVNLENVAFLQGSLSSFCEDMWEIERKAAKLFQKMLLWGFKESCITYNVCFLQSTCTHVTEFFSSKAGGQILQIYKILNFLHILYILYIFYVHHFFFLFSYISVTYASSNPCIHFTKWWRLFRPTAKIFQNKQEFALFKKGSLT